MFYIVFNQLKSRRELYRLKDSRFLLHFLQKRLIDAAIHWPSIFPAKWKPRSIFDVGANIGLFSEELSALYRPEFIAFVEPNLNVLPILRKKRLAKKTVVFPCAVGKKECSMKFNIIVKGTSNNMASSSLLKLSENARKYYHFKEKEVIDVPVRTLDSIFNDCQLHTLDLLKLDVQGYEIEALSGGIETIRRTRIILTEVSFYRQYREQPLFNELYGFMYSNYFELIGTTNFSFHRNTYYPLQCDACFINKKIPLF